MLKAVKNKSRLALGLIKAPIDLTNTKFIHYYGPEFEDSAIYDVKDFQLIMKSSKFNKGRNTVLYIHGYLETQEVESVRVIVEAYLKRVDTNLILLDWGELADGNYAFDAYGNAKQLGLIVAETLVPLFDNGLDIGKFHIVGHSMGGQIAGIIGRHVAQLSKNEKVIKRISALDPAFPLFYYFPFCKHISSNDAEFVDVIHTDAWLYGAPYSTGTADFWPNGGKTLQPGCPKRNYRMLTDNDLSSHRRSWWFWAESVVDSSADKFISVRAKNWNEFKSGNLIDSVPANVVMGHTCPTNITGDYFLQTNGSQPFGRGISGTIYIEPEQLPGFTYVEEAAEAT